MHSLYWKIFVTFLIVVVASLAAGSGVFHLAMGARMPPPRMDVGEAITTLVAFGIERLGREGLSLKQAAESVRGRLPPHARSMTLVLDGSGQLVSGEPGFPQALEMARQALTGPCRTETGPRRDGRGRPPAVAPCVAGAERGHVAFVLMRWPDEDWWPLVLRSTGAAAVTMLLVAALLGLLTFRLLTRRLTRLQVCMRGMADGDLTLRIAAPGSDEIGDLGRWFNRMATRLQAVVGELADTDRKRRQLLADISHELKTPLTVLRGQLEAVLDNQDPGSAPQVPISVALEESDRLALLIEDLLELARMQSSEFRLNRKEVTLQRIVQKALDRFGLAVFNRRVRLERELSPEPIRMSVDHRRIEQVVANLVQNALHGVHDGGWIKVSVQPQGEGATIEVDDDGRGIPAAELQHVFERFHTGSGEGGATGLGLSIVKQLVEAHGGTVHLECRPEGGIRAVVTLC
ncbi:MAG: HAMP domain-containing histidine kinase [Candidatus Riflebacteria bacterium]|nr:HAMP domain-containing histidine kinase [Candidatus Riflebacteria bacterium]